MIKIRGNDYITVNERVADFWETHPDWSITTHIMERSGKLVIMRCDIADDAGRIRATGTAYEMQGSTNVNATSHIENCETSAVGRALGILGIGIDTAIASAEEVQNAIVRKIVPLDDNNELEIRRDAIIEDLKSMGAKAKVDWLISQKLTEELLENVEDQIERKKKEEKNE